MKKNDLHPAVKAAKEKMTTRYIAFAICLVLSVILLVLGIFIKPKAKAPNAEQFSSKTAVDTFVKSDVTLVSALFSQDRVDDRGIITGENYHILAVDSEGNRFILTAPKEYYESTLKPLEDNSVQDIESGMLEILDENLTVEVYGYSRDMSPNLTEQLDTYFKGYEDVLLKYSLEQSEINEGTVTGTNIFYIFSGAVGIIALIVLLTAVSRTAEYKRVKKKHEEKNKKADKN